MNKIIVTDLIHYPIKSCKGRHLKECKVTHKGLEHDRNWALFDMTGQVITGRQYPDILDIEVEFRNGYVEVYYKDQKTISFPIESDKTQILAKKIFSYDVQGVKVNEDVDQWFSRYLNTDCVLLNTSKVIKRPVLPKHGGKANDIVSFADQAPLLMISEASLTDLNGRLKEELTMSRFRPNIVISGSEAYAEDGWQKVKIGDCEFEIIQQCERCIFTTIDPNTKKKDPNKEPLKTLSSYRKNANGGVCFGVHMVPRNLGIIQLNQKVEILM